MLSRAELKQRAKDSMSTATTHPVLVALVYAVITIAISGIVSVISNIFGAAMGVGANLIDSTAVAMGAVSGIFLISLVLGIVSSIVTYALTAGLTSYYLKTIRHEEAGLEVLFSYMKSWLKVFCLFFMIGLFTFLWSLLFVIPGIIAVYRYSMAIYIFVDDPNKGIMQCISESKEMMVGHKWELFVLELSFILWFLLGCVTCGLAFLYVSPYMGLTTTVYYDNLKYITKPQGFQSTPNQFENQAPTNA